MRLYYLGNIYINNSGVISRFEVNLVFIFMDNYSSEIHLPGEDMRSDFCRGNFGRIFGWISGVAWFMAGNRCIITFRCFTGDSNPRYEGYSQKVRNNGGSACGISLDITPVHDK